jgi:hypothetical protein
LKIDFVLVDFENVQPKNVNLLSPGPYKIKVFVGANQAKIPFEMARALRPSDQMLSTYRLKGTDVTPLISISPTASADWPLDPGAGLHDLEGHRVRSA